MNTSKLFLAWAIACAIAAVVLAAALYVKSQKGRFFFNRQEAGLLLLKGGYRSWKFILCDGETIVNGKLRPVVINSDGTVRPGYYWLPKFQHQDIRKLKIPGLTE